SWYVPPPSVRVNATGGRPGARFSFSPMTRLLFCSSTSVSAVAVLLVTVKVIGPALAVLWSSAQVPPLSPVRVIATCDTPFFTGATPACCAHAGTEAQAAALPTIRKVRVSLVHGMRSSLGKPGGGFADRRGGRANGRHRAAAQPEKTAQGHGRHGEGGDSEKDGQLHRPEIPFGAGGGDRVHQSAVGDPDRREAADVPGYVVGSRVLLRIQPHGNAAAGKVNDLIQGKRGRCGGRTQTVIEAPHLGRDTIMLVLLRLAVRQRQGGAAGVF